MAAAPRFKLFNKDGEYVGCLKYLTDAAAMASILGHGSTIRNGHSKSDIIWTEGKEFINAGESYDIAAEFMEKRLNERAATPWEQRRSRG